MFVLDLLQWLNNFSLKSFFAFSYVLCLIRMVLYVYIKHWNIFILSVFLEEVLLYCLDLDSIMVQLLLDDGFRTTWHKCSIYVRVFICRLTWAALWEICPRSLRDSSTLTTIDRIWIPLKLCWISSIWRFR